LRRSRLGRALFLLNSIVDTFSVILTFRPLYPRWPCISPFTLFLVDSLANRDFISFLGLCWFCRTLERWI
jgi:hypothetical protein